MDASSRQDIVLSGHFIKDEHCTFTSSAGPVEESEGSLFCYTGLELCLSEFNIDGRSEALHYNSLFLSSGCVRAV